MGADGLTGGSKLQEHLDRILKRVQSAQAVRVGFLESAPSQDGLPMATIAAINEFGNPAHNQPPRPFFRNMLDTKAKSWGEQAGKVLKAADYDARVALERMGDLIKDQLQGSIRTLTSPPLAPSTIRAKGFAKPLIDTGDMLRSVDYQVTGAG